MWLYKYASAGGRRILLTDDSSGGSLPRGTAWRRIGGLKIEPGDVRIGAAGDEILASIREHGYFPPPKAEPNA